MVKRVSKRVSEIVFLIAAGGSTYYLIEIWFRGIFSLDHVCAWGSCIDILQFSGRGNALV